MQKIVVINKSGSWYEVRRGFCSNMDKELENALKNAKRNGTAQINIIF